MQSIINNSPYYSFLSGFHSYRCCLFPCISPSHFQVLLLSCAGGRSCYVFLITTDTSCADDIHSNPPVLQCSWSLQPPLQWFYLGLGRVIQLSFIELSTTLLFFIEGEIQKSMRSKDIWIHVNYDLCWCSFPAQLWTSDIDYLILLCLSSSLLSFSLLSSSLPFLLSFLLLLHLHLLLLFPLPLSITPSPSFSLFCLSPLSLESVLGKTRNSLLLAYLRPMKLTQLPETPILSQLKALAPDISRES